VGIDVCKDREKIIINSSVYQGLKSLQNIPSHDGDSYRFYGKDFQNWYQFRDALNEKVWGSKMQITINGKSGDELARFSKSMHRSFLKNEFGAILKNLSANRTEGDCGGKGDSTINDSNTNKGLSGKTLKCIVMLLTCDFIPDPQPDHPPKPTAGFPDPCGKIMTSERILAKFREFSKMFNQNTDKQDPNMLPYENGLKNDILECFWFIPMGESLKFDPPNKSIIKDSKEVAQRLSALKSEFKTKWKKDMAEYDEIILGERRILDARENEAKSNAFVDGFVNIIAVKDFRKVFVIRNIEKKSASYGEWKPIILPRGETHGFLTQKRFVSTHGPMGD
jgi:hypothetical protein